MKKKSTGYKPIGKSRSNTSGRPGKAKKEAEKRKKAKTSKKTTPRKVFSTKKPFSYRLSALNPRAPKQLPETEITKKGMPLRKLLRGTPRLMMNNSLDVEILELKRTKTRSGLPAIKAITVTNDPYRPTKVIRKHKTFIIGAELDAELNPADKPVNKQKKVICSCDCVTGDMNVLTADGWKVVYAIAEPFEPNHFPIQYNIKGKLYWGSAPFYKGRQKTWSLHLSNGQKISATADHEFLRHSSVPSKGERVKKEVWTKLQELEVGNSLILNEFDKAPVEKDTQFWEGFFIGLLMGDGTLFACGSPDLKLYAHKKRLLKPLISLGIVRDTKEIKKHDGISVAFTQRARELCERYQYKNKESVKIPSTSALFGYTSGLIAADATVYKDGAILIRGGHPYLDQLNWLLMEQGIVRTTLYKDRGIGVDTSIIDGKQLTSTKELWSLRISGQANLRKHIVLSAYNKKRIRKPGKHPRKPWAKITDITYNGMQNVYDIMVPGPMRFCTNSVIAHNCENFVFTFEYANAASGASRIVYGNGEPPVVTNPTMAPGLCKHLVAVATRLIKSNK